MDFGKAGKRGLHFGNPRGGEEARGSFWLNGETESVAVIENELRETRGPASRIGNLLGPETRDIRCERNRIEGFAVEISDLRRG